MTTDSGMDIDPSYEEIIAERDEHEHARTALEELVGQLDAENKELRRQIAMMRGA